MSQKEDVLFCKIAILNGLVTEVDAQKVLALCDKREREAGRRPLIGPVFTKYNLLKQQDVQKVYDALRKRTGGAVGAERVTAAARGKGGAALKRRAEPVKAKRPIDPTTLWMGVGGMVVFLGILFAMLYIVMKPDPRTSSAAIHPLDSDGSGSAGSKAAAKKAAPVRREPVEAPKDYIHELKQLISDLRAEKADAPAEALKLLDAERKKCEDKSYILPKDLLDAVADFQERAREAGATAGGGAPAAAAGTAPAAGAVPAPGGAPAPGAAPGPAEAVPAAKPDEPAQDADIDNLLEETK